MIKKKKPTTEKYLGLGVWLKCNGKHLSEYLFIFKLRSRTSALKVGEFSRSLCCLSGNCLFTSTRSRENIAYLSMKSTMEVSPLTSVSLGLKFKQCQVHFCVEHRILCLSWSPEDEHFSTSFACFPIQDCWSKLYIYIFQVIHSLGNFQNHFQLQIEISWPHFFQLKNNNWKVFAQVANFAQVNRNGKSSVWQIKRGQC